METPKPKRKIFSIRNIIIGVGVLIVACLCLGVIANWNSPDVEPTQVAEAETGAEAVSQPTEADAPAIPTDTAAPTDTPHPTNTPKPTNTPRPTNTPAPTATPTPLPEPIVLSGSGDAIVDFEKWEGPAILQIDYTGGSNFIIETYDDQGNRVDLLINHIGQYHGRRPIEFRDFEPLITRLSIQASGAWEITVMPLQMMRRATVPGLIEGVGDDMIALEGGIPDIMTIDASQAESNFVIYTYGNGLDLLVNDIAPYTGQQMMDRDTFIIEVIAEGPWSLDITSR